MLVGANKPLDVRCSCHAEVTNPVYHSEEISLHIFQHMKLSVDRPIEMNPSQTHPRLYSAGAQESRDT